VTIIKTFAVIALTAYFYWVVIIALMRGRTPDFGRGIDRGEQPGKYWFQVMLYSLMAAGGTIYALVLLEDLSRS
jgi:hypothetical protein